MEVAMIKETKRIDIDVNALKWLSLKASKAEMNLKAFIEQKIIEIAESIEEEELCARLMQDDPEGFEMLDDKEEEAFRKYMGI
ncbi:MAG: hypothetical protein ACK5LR_07960 [Mangrovibacterium sp.]